MYLDVVRRKQLVVPHIVPFHPHERSVPVRPGIAVPFRFADAQLLADFIIASPPLKVLHNRKENRIIVMFLENKAVMDYS